MKLYEITAALEGLSRMAEDPDVPQDGEVAGCHLEQGVRLEVN